MRSQLSTTHGETVDYGTIITRAQALDSAIANLTEAITTAQGVGGVAADSIKNFALVGRSNTPWNQQYGPDKGSQLCLPLPQVELLNNPLLHS